MFKRKRHHASALWLCVDNSSSGDRSTSRSAASLSSSKCHLPGMRERRSHISIALGEIPNRPASSTGPPSRAMIEDAASIAGEIGTSSSVRQELFVPSRKDVPFYADDRCGGWREDDLMPVIRTAEEISAIAFKRLSDLLSDMGWDEGTAIAEFYREIAIPLNQTKKSVEQWWDREAIPLPQIFNVAEVLGVVPGWLTNQTHYTKAQAVRPGGLYAREVERESRRSGSKRTRN
jgi:hypothetical protein